MDLFTYIEEQLKEFEGEVDYDSFSNIVAVTAQQFQLSKEMAEKAILNEMQKKNLTVGTQEYTSREEWPAQKEVVPFGEGSPGWSAEPKSSLNPLNSLEMPRKKLWTKAFKFEKGTYVGVDENTWRSKFNGVIKDVKEDGTLVIEDFETGGIHEDIKPSEVSLPSAEGRPVAPPQYRRVGDPHGFLDSPSDQGDPKWKREFPGMYHLPRGQETNHVVNPPDLFYAKLMQKIVLSYGEEKAESVEKYLKGELLDPPKEIMHIINRYGVARLI